MSCSNASPRAAQTGLPGLGVTGDGLDPNLGQQSWKVSQRLPAGTEATIIDRLRGGTTIKTLAAKFSISESSVNRILRRNGVRRYRTQREG